MANVIPLFKRDSVQNTLEEALALGLTEVMIIGKKQKGGTWMQLSKCDDAAGELGRLRMLEHTLLVAWDAQEVI